MTEMVQETAAVAADTAMAAHVADVREDAIKAVKEAIAADPEVSTEEKPATEDQTPERGKNGKFQKKAVAKEAAPVEEEVTNSKVAKLLREREERNEARLQIRQERETLERERQAFAAEREAMAKEMERIKRMRTDPIAALREAHKEYGDKWSPEEFIQTLAKAGTTEGDLMRQNMTVRDELAEIKRQIADYTERETKYREQLNQQHQNQAAVATERRFVGVAMNEEKYPHLYDQFDGNESLLVQVAHDVGRQYHERTGEWATDEDIAEYLDAVRKERISKRQGSRSPVGASGNATPSRAQGSRTITTAGASEKRVVTQSADSDMSEEERREAAKAAVKAAVREYAS